MLPFRFNKCLTMATLFLFMPTLASAHTGFGETSGVLHGMIHPISGLDHLLAMIMVGVFAQQLGQRARWLVPLSLLALMTTGGATGILDLKVSLIETAIAVSVIMFGGMVALRTKMPTLLAMGIVGFFALFHGYARGAEIPDNIGGFAYGAGFLMMTAVLHALGIAMGFIVAETSRRHGSIIVRTSGALASLTGIGLLLNIITN